MILLVLCHLDVPGRHNSGGTRQLTGRIFPLNGPLKNPAARMLGRIFILRPSSYQRTLRSGIEDIFREWLPTLLFKRTLQSVYSVGSWIRLLEFVNKRVSIVGRLSHV
jgi:hypothetical protein